MPYLQPTRLLQRDSEWSAAGHHCTSSAGAERSCTSRPWLVPERPRASCPEGVALVASGVPNQVQAGTGDVHDPHTSVPRLPGRFCTLAPTATMIGHAIGSARRLVPATLFHVRGRNLATELSLWPGQSCGTDCQRQFDMRTVYSLLNADSSRTFSACVLMIDSVMPFRSGFVHGGH